jgi:hypothetical protein
MTTNGRTISSGRRDYLRALAGIGISGPSIRGFFGKRFFGKPDKVERVEALVHKNHQQVVKGAKPKRRKKTYTIPYEEYIQSESAASAAAKLTRKFGKSGINVGYTKVVDGKRLKGIIQPEYATKKIPTKKAEEPDIQTPDQSYSEFVGSLPETVTGNVDGESREFDVIPKKVTVEPECTLDYFTGEYTPIPGGCRIGTKYDGNCGTDCTPAYDNDRSEHVLTTAGHMVDNVSGKQVYQPNSTASGTDAISEKTQNSNSVDFATLRSPTSYKYSIAGYDPDTYTYPIKGIIHEDKLKDMANNGDYLYSQGAKTGRNYSQIKTLYYDGSGTTREVLIDHASDGGDSGGPYYQYDSTNDAVYIAACHKIGQTYANSDEKDAKGNTFNYLEGEFNITV